MNYEAAQLTDSDINDLLSRNSLIIRWNESIKKWELLGTCGAREYFMSRSPYKTALIVSAKQVDKRRASKSA